MESPQAFAVGRNHFFAVFWKIKVKSEDVSYPAESPAILGRIPLSDITEIIGEGTGKSWEKEAFCPRTFILISPPPSVVGRE